MFHLKNTNGINSSEALNMTHKSKVRNVLSTGTVPTKVLRPMMARRLNIFEPMTLPKATSACRRKAAVMVVANSGREVPNATSVKQNGKTTNAGLLLHAQQPLCQKSTAA